VIVSVSDGVHFHHFSVGTGNPLVGLHAAVDKHWCARKERFLPCYRFGM